MWKGPKRGGKTEIDPNTLFSGGDQHPGNWKSVGFYVLQAQFSFSAGSLHHMPSLPLRERLPQRPGVWVDETALRVTSASLWIFGGEEDSLRRSKSNFVATEMKLFFFF